MIKYRKLTTLILAGLSTFLVSSCIESSVDKYADLEFKLVEKYNGEYCVGSPIDIQNFFYCENHNLGEISVNFNGKSEKVHGNIYYPTETGEHVFTYKLGDRSLTKKVNVTDQQPLISCNKKPYCVKKGKMINFEDLFDLLNPSYSPSIAHLEIDSVEYSPFNQSLTENVFEYTPVEFSDYFTASEVGYYKVNVKCVNGSKQAVDNFVIASLNSLYDGNDSVLKIGNKYASKNVLVNPDNPNLYTLMSADYDEASFVTLNEETKLGEKVEVIFKGKNIPSIAMMAQPNANDDFGPSCINGYTLTFERDGTYRYTLRGPDFINGTGWKMPKEGRDDFFGLDDLDENKIYSLSCLISGNKDVTDGNGVSYKQHFLNWSIKEVFEYGTINEYIGPTITEIVDSGWQDHNDLSDDKSYHVVFYSSAYSDITFEVLPKVKEVEKDIIIKGGAKTGPREYSYSNISYTNDKTNGNVASSDYLAFKGNYGKGDLVTFDFDGQNIPAVAILCDDISDIIGGKGILLDPGTKNADLRKRMTIRGPYKQCSHDVTLSKNDQGNYDSIDWMDRYGTVSNSKFGRNNLDSSKKYTYVVKIDDVNNGTVKFTFSLFERSNNDYLIVDSQQFTVNGYIGPSAGNIIAYPDYNDASRTSTTFKYYPVNENPVPIQTKYRATVNGNNVSLTGAGFTNDSAKDVSYYGVQNSCAVGKKIKVNYTGKNIPGIVLFADTPNGQLAKGGSGIYLATSYVIWSNLSDKNPERRLTTYGPYRWSPVDTGDWFDTYRFTDKIVSQKSATEGFGVQNQQDGVNYQYVVEIVSFDKLSNTMTFKASITNLDTQSEVISSTISIDWTDKIISGNEPEFGDNIIFYGLGHDISFSYTIE